MWSSSDSFVLSVRLTRRTATVTISAPEASCACTISCGVRYFPVPTISRERKRRPAITSASWTAVSVVAIVKILSPTFYGGARRRARRATAPIWLAANLPGGGCHQARRKKTTRRAPRHLPGGAPWHGFRYLSLESGYYRRP